MQEQLALRLLRRIMGWDDETAAQEYRWVRLISRLKYDGYGDYLAGVRFAESLAGWLNQFDPKDRQASYDFVKTRLVYFSPAEIQRLVEQLYPRFVEPRLRNAVANELSLPAYIVLSNAEARRRFDRKRRQTLFIGLSDGARLDILRRANTGVLTNDQVVLATHIDDEKWIDLGKKLAENPLFAGEQTPVFESVYLIDDFTGSGTTFLRQKKDGAWTGKVKKFWDVLAAARQSPAAAGRAIPVSERFSLHIHHYISSDQARNSINERLRFIASTRDVNQWFHEVIVTEGFLLPATTPISAASDPAMWAICDKYYDHDLYERLKEHLEESGQTHAKHGYAHAALPVIMDHNCPNNSISLLWAETDGKSGHHTMRPLFPRRHRHS
jgi:hypothetical protein